MKQLRILSVLLMLPCMIYASASSELTSRFGPNAFDSADSASDADDEKSDEAKPPLVNGSETNDADSIDSSHSSIAPLDGAIQKKFSGAVIDDANAKPKEELKLDLPPRKAFLEKLIMWGVGLMNIEKNPEFQTFILQALITPTITALHTIALYELILMPYEKMRPKSAVYMCMLYSFYCSFIDSRYSKEFLRHMPTGLMCLFTLPVINMMYYWLFVPSCFCDKNEA